MALPHPGSLGGPRPPAPSQRGRIGAERPPAPSYRGRFGAERPPALAALALPPAPMPSRLGLRPLKSWRYVGVYGPELMLCIGAVRIGPAHQAFWAVWDRAERRLHERTVIGRGGVRLCFGRAAVHDRDVAIELTLEEEAGIEVVCPSGEAYAWTRKQGGIRAHGSVTIAGRCHRVDARAVIDDTAGYYQRHTCWMWSAGVGTAAEGRAVAWNLVAGVNDPPAGSERTVWVDGVAAEAPPSTFAPDLSAVDGLLFEAEATRRRQENLLLIRSDYVQPFGTFSGSLPGGIPLAEGYGVIERHDVRW